MSFNTFVFVVFGFAFFALWPWFRDTPRLRWTFLALASFVFYGWSDPRFLLLLVATGLVDYLAALEMVRRPRARGALLALSLGANLGLLVAFKYAHFVLENLEFAAGLLGFSVSLPRTDLTLPVGISFYTFQSMSYTIDVYRGEIAPTRSVLHFFAYLSLFPQLVAGPIVRARDFLAQLETRPRPTADQVRDGLGLLALGYFRKNVIADNLAPVVNDAFARMPPGAGLAWWWPVMAMFAFQIYNDFAGYSDIARGLAKLMGYEFRVNFRNPYCAGSLREFWTRWHISLSTWFRDYLYLPLGGSRVGTVRAHANLWIVMLLSGLWHGAAWTFVAWAAVHAALLSGERLTHWPDALRGRIGRCLRPVLIFALGCLAWVFFRAVSIDQALEILRTMLTPSLGTVFPSADALRVLALAASIELYQGLREEALETLPRLARFERLAAPVAHATLGFSAIFLRGPGNAFIYFRF